MEFFDFATVAEALFFNDVGKHYMWAYLVIAGVCFAVVYVFQSIGLYTIACRGGFKNKWMAFVPFLNVYYIGVLSDKNKIFNFKAKYVAIVAAALEFAYVALYALYYVAQFLIFDGGYAVPEYELFTVGGLEYNIVTSYNISSLPHGLEWAGTVYKYFPNAVLSWISLLNVVASIFLLIAFFQTYSCRHYVLFALLSVFFPIKGILMFAVRNNAGKNYGQYLRERQQQQYRDYQEYMRRNGGYNNYNVQNPYNGGSYFGGNSAPQDPFDGMGGGSNNGNQSGGNEGSSSGGSSGDPFEDF